MQTHQVLLLAGGLVRHPSALLLLCWPRRQLPQVLLLLARATNGLRPCHMSCCASCCCLRAQEGLLLTAPAAAVVLVMVPAVVAAACLQLEHLLTPALQGPIVDELHHHEHVCYHKVPVGLRRRQAGRTSEDRVRLRCRICQSSIIKRHGWINCAAPLLPHQTVPITVIYWKVDQACA